MIFYLVKLPYEVAINDGDDMAWTTSIHAAYAYIQQLGFDPIHNGNSVQISEFEFPTEELFLDNMEKDNLYLTTDNEIIMYTCHDGFEFADISFDYLDISIVHIMEQILDEMTTIVLRFKIMLPYMTEEYKEKCEILINLLELYISRIYILVFVDPVYLDGDTRIGLKLPLTDAIHLNTIVDYKYIRYFGMELTV